MIKIGSVTKSRGLTDNDYLLGVVLEFGRNEIVTKIDYVNESILLSSLGGSISSLIDITTILNGVLSEPEMAANVMNSIFEVKELSRAIDAQTINNKLKNVEELELHSNGFRISKIQEEKIRSNVLMKNIKKPYKISGIDILKSRMKHSFCKKILGKQDQILIKLGQIIASSLEYSSLIKLKLDLLQIKQFLLPNHLTQLFDYPEVLINSSDCIAKLENNRGKLDQSKSKKQKIESFTFDFEFHMKQKFIESVCLHLG